MKDLGVGLRGRGVGECRNSNVALRRRSWAPNMALNSAGVVGFRCRILERGIGSYGLLRTYKGYIGYIGEYHRGL